MINLENILELANVMLIRVWLKFKSHWCAREGRIAFKKEESLGIVLFLGDLQV